MGRSVLTWELAAICACRRNEKTGRLREKEFDIFARGGLVEEFKLESWEVTYSESHFLKGSCMLCFCMTQPDLSYLRFEQLSLEPDICCHLLLAFLTPIPVWGVSVPHISLADLPPVFCSIIWFFSQAWPPAGILPFSSLAVKCIHSAFI